MGWINLLEIDSVYYRLSKFVSLFLLIDVIGIHLLVSELTQKKFLRLSGGSHFGLRLLVKVEPSDSNCCSRNSPDGRTRVFMGNGFSGEAL